MTPPLSRRDALKFLTAAAGSTLFAGCKLTTEENNPIITLPTALITPRPGVPTMTTTPGLHELPDNNSFSFGQYFVPSSYNPDIAIPLVLLFHGAGQRSNEILSPMAVLAEEMGIALMATDSREYTWDVIKNGYFGTDRNFINRALPAVFDRVRIDPNKIGIAGFSDGASYALSLGIINGDLFRRIVAFSPGFIVTGYASLGNPDVFITHGTGDPVLPIATTKTVIIPRLQTENHSVEFHEFAGGHEIPANLMRDATVWLKR